MREPHAAAYAAKIATSDRLLYRRGNFGGAVDQVICDALLSEFDAEIALSPGFRWGNSVLPGQPVAIPVAIPVQVGVGQVLSLTENGYTLVRP